MNDLIGYNALTSGIALDEESNVVVLVFETKEGKTVQIGLSGTGLAGLDTAIGKLKSHRPEVLEWTAANRH